MFCKILLKISCQVDKILSDRQFSFRAGRGTADAIFIMRQIFEKTREHQVSLNIHFVDFKAAFDTVWRKSLWVIMGHMGISNKVVDITEQSAVLIDEN